MTRKILIVVALVLMPRASNAQTIPLSRPSLAPDRASIVVSVGAPPPDVAVVENAAIWVVSARSPAAPAGQQLPISTVRVTQFYADTGQVRLTFSSPVPDVVTEIDVITLPGKTSRVTWKPRTTKTSTIGFFPAANRSKADVFIFGGWAGGVNTTPLYTLDIAAAAPVREFEFQKLQWRFTLAGTWKTASSPNLDPDSITVSSRLATIFPAALRKTGPYLDFQWDTLRFEFSRKDKATNILTAPGAVLAHAIHRRGAGNQITASFNFEAAFGLELGGNLENKIVSGGYGAIVRFVPGGAVYLVLPGALGLDEVRWTTLYRVRLLAADEPLIDARGDVPVITIEKGARHEWSDELALKFNAYVGLNLKHEYGSTPPAFKLLDHRGTVGLTVMWAWKQ